MPNPVTKRIAGPSPACCSGTLNDGQRGAVVRALPMIETCHDAGSTPTTIMDHTSVSRLPHGGLLQPGHPDQAVGVNGIVPRYRHAEEDLVLTMRLFPAARIAPELCKSFRPKEGVALP
jgi:hypothetical protein